MRNRIVIPTLILSAILSGCGGDPSGSSDAPLTPAEFVEIVVEIREAEREVAAEDSAAELFDDRRREILDRHGTTEAELRAFLSANAENLALLEEVWDTIHARLTLPPPGVDAVGEEEARSEEARSEEVHSEQEGPEELDAEEVEDDSPGPPRRVLPPPRDGESIPVIR